MSAAVAVDPAPRYRIEPLDGFRAVAVLLVIGYHYLTDLALRPGLQHFDPFGDAYAGISVLRLDNMGVDLFFIISGFVIAMTLNASRGPADFAIKRFARLMPSMLLCSVITYAALSMLPLPTWPVAPIDFLPGWTFTSESTWSDWLGRPIGVVDGAYWSLVFEVRFYALAGLLHFALKKVPLLWSLTLLLNAVWLLVHLPLVASDSGVYAVLKALTVYDKLPLFLAGIAFYSVSRGEHRRMAFFVLLETFVMLLARYRFEAEHGAALGLFYLLFFGLLYAPQAVAVFAWKPLVAIGASSYAIYLLHNRLGVSITYNLAPFVPASMRESLLLSLGTTVFILALSWIVYRWWEIPSRQWITQWWAARAARARPAVAEGSSNA